MIPFILIALYLLLRNDMVGATRTR
jgi:hypothetical protein